MNEPVIDVHDMEFAWARDGAAVLAIERLTVERGARLFLKGPSGSGKSTLLNLLGGVTVPRRGTVTVLGQDLAALGGAARDRFRADHVGYIFQLFNLVPYLTVLDNVLLPLRFSRARRERTRGRGSLRAEAGRLITQLGLGAAAARAPGDGPQRRPAAAGGGGARADRGAGTGDRGRADLGARRRHARAVHPSADGRMRRAGCDPGVRQPRRVPGDAV